MQEEIWADAKGYETYIEVSTIGRIRTKSRLLVAADGRKYRIKQRISKIHIMSNGYAVATIYMYDNNRTKKKELVHRLVAMTFIPNPNNLPQVNHKDENKLNNLVDNLEWCTAAYNLAYGTKRLREASTKSKPVNQYDMNNNLIKSYPSLTVAAKAMNGDISTISAVCRCKQHCHTAYGYKWGFA